LKIKMTGKPNDLIGLCLLVLNYGRVRPRDREISRKMEV